MIFKELLYEAEIQTIKFIPGQKDLEARDCNGNHAAVSAKWLKQNTTLSQSFLDEVLRHKKVSKREAKTFRCPPGKISALTSDAECMEALTFTTKGMVPPIQFPQDPTKFTCLVNSFSSALYHFGLKDQAKQINYHGELLQSSSQYICHFFDIIHRHIGKLYCLRRMKHRSYNPIKDATNLPVIGILHAKGKGSAARRLNHCVCFLGNFIFEPSLSHPVPRSKHSLDVICGGEYLRLSKAWCLTKRS